MKAWLLLLLCAPALAQDPNPVGRSLAATCANCHGTEGRPRGSTMAPLAGMKAETLLQVLSDFRRGARPGTVMPQIVKGYTEEQLRLVAAHFSALPPVQARP
ncbi:cytochrome c553 [Pelomonas aquatica]|jgi:cytochrome c553|uniref:Cytochrome c553 n=1 Tax=Pelomonas aquatica TaxID=431058 RepID=A0ABU1ZCB4_9BURK|nr:cytochrome C [Pelomonas aquatica]MDR7298267.1 cytochrome c553 [Pelomonas aquatica]